MADNMAETGSRLGEHAENIAGEAQEAGHDIAETASAYAQQAKEYVKQGYDAAAEKTKAIKKTTEGYITENPWIAIGVALGVGVVVGILLRPRRD